VRLGFSIPLPNSDVRETCGLARLAEALGYSDAWAAETSGPDAFSVASAVGVSTTTLRIGIAIAPVFTRPPALIAMSALAAQQACRGRFVLGLGASSEVIVSRWMGERYEMPVVRVRETVEAVRQALSGDKVRYDGKTVAVRGFKLDQPPSIPVPIYLAALGPRMLELAAEVGDGVALFLASEEGVRIAAKAAPGKEIVERIVCVPNEPEEEVRGTFRRMFAPYLAVPGYNRFVAAQGFEAEAEGVRTAWASGDRKGALAAVSDRLVDAMLITGPADRCKERLESFRDAGLSTPILFFLSSRGPEAIVEGLKAMAP
jgi:probable F420-dependent oxidoreductase